MEELCQRFPLIAQKILNHVDNETLTNFKEIGRNIDDFLRKERFYWLRIIQRYNCLVGEHHEVWNKVVRKTPVEIIKEFAFAVHQFPQTMFRELKNDSLSDIQFFKGVGNQIFEDKPTSCFDVLQFEYCWHPLFVVAACGSVNLCNHIIQKTGVTDPRLPYRRRNGGGTITPFVFAAKNMGDVNVFKFLLEKAEDKNPFLRQDRKWTFLHDLAGKGRLELCRLIVNKVEDKSPQDCEGHTPFHFAAAEGHVEVCKILMKDLMDKNPKDHQDRTPLHFATMNGHVELCQHLVKYLTNRNPQDIDGQTPLHMAADRGHVELCQILMEDLIDKNPKNHQDRTPLHFATMNGYVELCQHLVKYLTDRNPQDIDGQTPLHMAADKGHVELCQILMEYGMDKNLMNHRFRSPFDIAAYSGHLEICRLFMVNCVDKNHLDDDIRRPLHIAALKGNLEILRLFMDNIMDKNLRNNELSSFTPLHSAIQGDHLNLCKLLIVDYKVDVNLSDGYGMTPLLQASKLEKPEIFKFLCKNTFTNYGKTPLDPAVLEHKREIDAFLENRVEVAGLSMVNILDKNVMDNTYAPLREDYEEI